MTYLLLLIGFLLLIKGADYFVEGSSSVAKLLKVPSVIIGLTIVAMGTSAPEAAVSITAGLAGNNEIALSNIVGSNFFNLLVVVGVSAAVKPFLADKSIIKRDYPISILLTIILWFFARDGILTRLEGVILLVLFVSYIGYMVYTSLKNRTTSDEPVKTLSPIKSALYILGGIAAIIYGGDLVVDSASKIAATFGLSQTLIGLTIVAIGTSLPELVTSLVAARKGESELALGNVVGSNIFNIVFILGSSVAISPIAVAFESITDIILLLGATVLVYIFIRSGSKVTRTQGIISVLLYVLYTAYIIMR